MKFNIAYPAYGSKLTINVDNEQAIRAFMDKRISHQVEADTLGEAWKGYVVKVTGGCDKEGFAMKQGILTQNRVRVLLKCGDSHFNQKRDGYRKRKTVRGCIVSPALAVINLVILKRGEADIAGLTDEASQKPAKFFIKRASKLRKLFGLDKKADVRKYTIKRLVEKTTKKGKKVKYTVSPKIQRLVTPRRVAMKVRAQKAIRAKTLATKKQAEEFSSLIQLRRKQFAAQKSALQKKRSLSRKESQRKASTNQ